MYDAFILKCDQIDVGNEDNRGAPLSFHLPVKIAVDLYFHRSGAVGAFRPDNDRHEFFSELPLHEGRRKRVGRSGRVQLLAAMKRYLVRRFCNRDGICPLNFSLGVPEDEGHVRFQVIQNGDDPLERNIYRL